MIAARDSFGPWRHDIARLCLGPRGEALAESLRRAETDAGQLEPALHALGALAALDRRQVLASFAALNRGGR